MEYAFGESVLNVIKIRENVFGFAVFNRVYVMRLRVTFHYSLIFTIIMMIIATLRYSKQGEMMEPPKDWCKILLKKETVTMS